VRYQTPSGAINESRTYNARLQLTSIDSGLSGVRFEYIYSATQNNGRIVNANNWRSSTPGDYEQITYTYDSLNRLNSAASNDATQCSLTFHYDRFGNRDTQSATGPGGCVALNHSDSFNPATNYLNGGVY